jgi:hypothetical protein
MRKLRSREKRHDIRVRASAARVIEFYKRILNHSKIAHRTFKQFYFARVEFRLLHQ